SPTVTTSATPQATAGGTISDQATLAGGVGPTGTITFTVFGPNDATCSGTPTSGGSAPVSGNGTYPSSAVPVVLAGTYRWIASYGGGSNNAAWPTACADPAEAVVVTKAAPALTTTASGSVAAGGSVNDVAHLTLGTNPTGTISFTLYSDAGCTVSVFTSSATVTGNGDYSSGPFTATQAGTYHWRASYSGDGNNNAAGPTACADPAEAVVVTKAAPALTTTASGSVAAGGQVSDVAHLTLGTNPTGTISFTLYGPNDATCTVVAFTDTKLVSGNADYTSSSFTAIQAGTYRWIASYSGDLNNNAAGPTACADPAEAVVVTKASPVLTTTASGSVAAGGQVSDVAHLTLGTNPTGTISFTLYSDAGCTVSVFTSSATVDHGNGDYASGPFTANEGGAYRWIASYSG